MKSVDVKKGDTVQEGAKIGITGKTGNASNLKDKEAHLHFEISEEVKPTTGKKGNEQRENPKDYMDINDAKKEDQKE